MPSVWTPVSTVMTGATWVTVTIPLFDPASLRRAISAAASAHPTGAMTNLVPDRGGGLSASAEVGASNDVPSAALLAAESLESDGYCVTLVSI